MAKLQMTTKQNSPKKQLWSKGQELDQNVHLFTVGLDPINDLLILKFDLLASAAHAKMLTSIGILKPKECNQLLAQISNMYSECLKGNFTISTEEEDCHTAIENRLVDSLGEVGKKIHTGRSRNDQVLVATRLYLRDQVVQIVQKLIDFADVLINRSENLKNCLMPGYTHTQRAMPTSAATLLMSYAEYILSVVSDGIGLYKRINWNPLGSGSGFGVPLELDFVYTTSLLAFDRHQGNPIFIHSSRGREELKFLNWLNDLGFIIEKAASDLVLFATEEFGFVKLPERFTTGSSIMPQKRNPDVLELLRGSVGKIRGARSELESTINKLSSSYHRDFQLIKEPIFRLNQLPLTLVSIFTAVIKEIEFNETRCTEALSASLFATHYAYSLVEEAGHPFREAYLMAANALKSGEINELTFIDKTKLTESSRVTESITEAKKVIQGANLALTNLLHQHETMIQESLKPLEIKAD